MGNSINDLMYRYFREFKNNDNKLPVEIGDGSGGILIMGTDGSNPVPIPVRVDAQGRLILASEVNVDVGDITIGTVEQGDGDPSAVPWNVRFTEPQEVTLTGQGDPLPVTIAGSGDSIGKVGIQDRDLILRSYDGIIDTIGADNIALFLPLWEDGTEFRDLLKPDIVFKAGGANSPTPRQPGLLHPVPGFSHGFAQNLQEQPSKAHTENDGAVDLKEGSHKAAQKLVGVADDISFVRLLLQRTGTLADATLQVKIYSDDSGPDVELAASVNTLAASALATDVSQWRGFAFDTPVPVRKGSAYWIVLEYADGTGVDAGNYVSWLYDSTSGDGRAHFDGAWTETSNQSHAFDVYGDHLRLDGSFSIIAAVNMDSENQGPFTILQKSTYESEVGVQLEFSSAGDLRFLAHTEAGGATCIGYRYPSNRWAVIGGIFDQAVADDKLKLYLDGRLTGTLNREGGAGSQIHAPIQPLSIGASLRWTGTRRWYFLGSIGPVIITRNALTAAQVGEINSHLSLLRKLGG